MIYFNSGTVWIGLKHNAFKVNYANGFFFIDTFYNYTNSFIARKIVSELLII